MNALKILREEGYCLCKYIHTPHIPHRLQYFKAVFVIHAVATCGAVEQRYTFAFNLVCMETS